MFDLLVERIEACKTSEGHILDDISVRCIIQKCFDKLMEDIYPGVPGDRFLRAQPYRRLGLDDGSDSDSDSEYGSGWMDMKDMLANCQYMDLKSLYEDHVRIDLR